MPRSFLSATRISSGSKWSISNDDWVDAIIWVSLDVWRIIAANKLIALGCKPSSGSSTKITDGRSSSGCRNSVASARKRSVPSENACAPKYLSDFLCFQANLITFELMLSGLSMKSSNYGATRWRDFFIKSREGL